MGMHYELWANQVQIAKKAEATLSEQRFSLKSPGIFPGDLAPIVRAIDGQREILIARWGMPPTKRWLFESAAKYLEKQQQSDYAKARARIALDPNLNASVPIIGDVRDLHWKKWLKVKNRCIVPFNAFAEADGRRGKHIRFAIDYSQPLSFFAGAFVTLKLRPPIVAHDHAFALLSAKSINADGERRRKPLPVPLATSDELELWMTAPIDEALALRMPAQTTSLKIV
jgi:putative SOS response-associated peptidase YedK